MRARTALAAAVLFLGALAVVADDTTSEPTSSESTTTSTTPIPECTARTGKVLCLTDGECSWNDAVGACSKAVDVTLQPRITTRGGSVVFNLPPEGDLIVALRDSAGVITEIPITDLRDEAERNAGAITQVRSSASSSIALLSGTVATLETTLSSRIAAVSAATATNTDAIVSMGTSVGTRFTTLQGSASTNAKAISDLQTQQRQDVLSLTSSITDSLDRISTLSTSVTTRFTSTATSIGLVDQARVSLGTSVDSRFVTVNTGISQSVVSITSVANAAASLASQIILLQAADTSIASQIVALQSRDSTFSTQIAALQTSAATVSSQIVAILSTQGAHSTSISSLLSSASYFSRVTRPTSCSLLQALSGISTNGVYTIYWIHNPDRAIQAYCHFVDGSVFTSIPCTQFTGGLGCTQTWSHRDPNSCRENGYEIMPYRTKNAYISLINYYGSAWFSVTPVYRDTGGGSYSSCIMRRGGCGDWRVADGGNWWLRDATFGEPSGDYTGSCWMQHSGWDANALTFNDANCNYVTSRYICRGPDA